MKLSYFEMLSPLPISIANIGSIVSPKLRDIASIGYPTYQFYLTVLLLDLKSYLEMSGQGERFLALSDEEKEGISIFDVLLEQEESSLLLQRVLNFFMADQVIYTPGQRNFIVRDPQEQKTVGTITRDNYPMLRQLICRLNYVTFSQEEDPSKAKSKKARDIMKKLQKGRAEHQKHKKSDANMELGNVISAVAGRSPSLNLLTIWDLTIFQLWDCFSRLSNNAVYDIQSMSVAAWGNKDHSFDAADWFKATEFNSF